MRQKDSFGASVVAQEDEGRPVSFDEDVVGVGLGVSLEAQGQSGLGMRDSLVNGASHAFGYVGPDLTNWVG